MRTNPDVGATTVLLSHIFLLKINKEFDIVEFFQGVKYVDLERHIKSAKRHELTQEYLDLYSFVKKDTVFVDFIQRINGVHFS